MLKSMWDKVRGLFHSPIAAREVAPVPPWITIERYSGKADGYWKVVDMTYYDPGNTVVYAYAEDAARKPSLMSKAMQSNGGLTLLPFEMKDGRAEATFGMTGDSSFDPKRGEVGPYSLAIFGASDKVRGIGLPLKQHVELHVTFRWTLNDAPPPPPPTGQYVEVAQFHELWLKEARQLVDNA